MESGQQNPIDPEAIEQEPSSHTSTSTTSYHTAVLPEPSFCKCCKSFFWSLISSPFYKTEVPTLSLVHFICTLAIGISLSIAAEIKETKHVTKSNLYTFLVVYMWISIVWIIGAFCFGNKSGCCLAQRQHDGHIHGYLIIGVTFLCIGSSFITAVESLPFVFSSVCNSTITVEAEKKDEISKLMYEAIFAATKFVFLILQLYFFCRFSNKTFLDTWSMQIFLMHIIAVNLCTWFYIIVDESVDPKKRNSSYPMLSNSCPPFKDIEIFRKTTDSFLYPFSIEYSVMSSVLLFLLWYGLRKPRADNARPPTENRESTEHKQNTCFQRLQIFFLEKCCKDGIPQGENKPSSFWRSAICGYVLGVVMLIFILLIVTVLAEEFKDDQNVAAYFYRGSRIAILLLMSFVCLFGLKYLREHDEVDQLPHTIVDTALIMIGVSGCYLVTGFHITAAGSVLKSCTSETAKPETELSCKYLRVTLVDYVCGLIQFTLQAFFIVRALRRCSLVPRCSPDALIPKGKISSAMVVRRCSAFLSIANIGMWAMATYELKDVDETEFPEIRAYTKDTWLILSHVAFPLCIFFRLHSVFCCFEIVINRFEVILPGKRSSYKRVPNDDSEIGDHEDAMGVQ